MRSQLKTYSVKRSVVRAVRCRSALRARARRRAVGHIPRHHVNRQPTRSPFPHTPPRCACSRTHVSPSLLFRLRSQPVPTRPTSSASAHVDSLSPNKGADGLGTRLAVDTPPSPSPSYRGQPSKFTTLLHRRSAPPPHRRAEAFGTASCVSTTARAIRPVCCLNAHHVLFRLASPPRSPPQQMLYVIVFGPPHPHITTTTINFPSVAAAHDVLELCFPTIYHLPSFHSPTLPRLSHVWCCSYTHAHLGLIDGALLYSLPQSSLTVPPYLSITHN